MRTRKEAGSEKKKNGQVATMHQQSSLGSAVYIKENKNNIGKGEKVMKLASYL